MRVMVTGGTGFLGGHTVRALVDAGHEPRLLVRSEEKLAQLGHVLGWDAMANMLNQVSGCHRSIVRVTREDLLAAIPEEEAVEMMLGFRPGNDAPLLAATGVTWRPIEETYRDTIAWMLAHGYLEPQWAPAIANAATG